MRSLEEDHDVTSGVYTLYQRPFRLTSKGQEAEEAKGRPFEACHRDSRRDRRGAWDRMKGNVLRDTRGHQLSTRVTHSGGACIAHHGQGASLLGQTDQPGDDLDPVVLVVTEELLMRRLQVSEEVSGVTGILGTDDIL